MDCAKIKSLREKLGMSQEEASRRAGFNNRQYWYNIESGLRTNIKIQTLEAIASALGVKARELLK